MKSGNQQLMDLEDQTKSVPCEGRYNGLKSHVNELLTALDDDIAQFSSLPDFDYRRNLIRAAIREMCENPDQNFTSEDKLPAGCLQVYTDCSQNGTNASERSEPIHSSVPYATGEAVFLNDIKIRDVAYGGVVLSTEAHAKILKVDTETALKTNGVLGYVDINDIPKGGTNYPGSLLHEIFGADDTPMFADKEVLAVGQVIGLVVAKSPETARRAAKLVKIHYQQLPAVLTMEEAIEQKSYHLDPFQFGASEEMVENELSKCDIVIEGTTSLGGQDHCYMETQGSVAVPGKHDEWYFALVLPVYIGSFHK
ncbi:hypothetical protein GCK32_008413 [Trichostrongylus colubriformis]|uniref:Aldehyde oxidase/xanthine dehydrogenase a/b hammerhead domain-containing protein n=1 Tax=Trichostrongylus colubriformis TaxID=6319 RepID=A0AAN8F7H6_TRICO